MKGRLGGFTAACSSLACSADDAPAGRRSVNIGEASEVSGVSQRMIRHYEKIGLIPAPMRRGSGYRDYGVKDVNRLRFIANARDLGFPIEEIRMLLSLWDDRARSHPPSCARSAASCASRKRC